MEYENVIGQLEGIRKMRPELAEPSIVTANSDITYDIMNFDKSSVDIHFIISSLSKINRFLGHTGTEPHHVLTVAQHCVMMAESILLVTGNAEIAMQALWHEGAEPYIGDMISPLKNILKDHYKPIEKNIEKIVFEVLDIEYPMHPMVKHVDLNICEYELTFAVVDDYKQCKYDFWSSEESYNKFLAMHNRLSVLVMISRKD